MRIFLLFKQNPEVLLSHQLSTVVIMGSCDLKYQPWKGFSMEFSYWKCCFKDFFPLNIRIQLYSIMSMRQKDQCQQHDSNVEHTNLYNSMKFNTKNAVAAILNTEYQQRILWCAALSEPDGSTFRINEELIKELICQKDTSSFKMYNTRPSTAFSSHHALLLLE